MQTAPLDENYTYNIILHLYIYTHISTLKRHEKWLGWILYLTFSILNHAYRNSSLLNCMPRVLKTCSCANVSCVLTYSRANIPCVFTCQRVLRADVITCQHVLHAYMLTCLACWRAHMPTCLACLRAHMSTCLTR